MLEVDLYVLGVFDEEAESEDERDAEAEVEAVADGALGVAVEVPAHEEEASVGNGLVELAGMARLLVDALEDESPRYIGHLTYNLAVHEVSQTDEAGGNGGGDGDVVEHRP